MYISINVCFFSFFCSPVVDLKPVDNCFAHFFVHNHVLKMADEEVHEVEEETTFKELVSMIIKCNLR